MPMTKSDGTLDVSSLLSHIALLEQSMEGKASATETEELKTQLHTALGDLQTAQAELKITQTELKTTQTELKAVQVQLSANQVNIDELKEVKSDLKATQTAVALLQLQLKSASSQCNCNVSASVSQPSSDITSLRSDVSILKTEVFQLQSQRNVSNGGGSTFTRWGRTVCPADTKIIYKGYTGGTGYGDKASSASILCLPEHPIYASHSTSSHLHDSYIYGTEYTAYLSGTPFQGMEDDDMPCVVCKSETKSTSIMVPARNQCYAGWTLEYSGYVMGASDEHASAEFICVDKDAEAVPGSKDDKDGQVLYLAKSRCGSLPCPPYQNNWEITCAVCSN